MYACHYFVLAFVFVFVFFDQIARTLKPSSRDERLKLTDLRLKFEGEGRKGRGSTPTQKDMEERNGREKFKGERERKEREGKGRKDSPLDRFKKK